MDLNNYKKYLTESSLLSSIDKEILHVFIDYGFTNPYSDIITKIELTDKPGYFNVTRKVNNGREVKQIVDKIGVVLKEIFPTIDLTGNQEVQQMIHRLKLLSNRTDESFYVEEYDNISDWYVRLESCKVKSCVNCNKRNISFV